MRGIRRTGPPTAVVLAALLTGTAAAPPAGAAPPHTAAAAGAGSVVKVTLITGDEVTARVGADGTVSVVAVLPGPGREDIAFTQQGGGDSLSLVPQDAVAPLRAGYLDPRLFDITGLVAQGYDDAHSPRLPLIVTYDKAAGGKAAPRPSAGVTSVRTLASMRGAALRADKKRVSQVWKQWGPAVSKGRPAAALAPGVAKVWLDGKVGVSLDRSTAQVGAPQSWKSGWTGKGVKVAVLDTGIDSTHPDFSGSIGESADFTQGSGVSDGDGHGTHVASTIAGDGAASDGRYRGMAPDAELLVGKVLDDNGGGQESWVLQGMEWAAARAPIVNLSLSGAVTDGTDPLSQAVDNLSASHGTLFVVAAGNLGRPGTVSAPGTADAALTVGAVERDDTLAGLSSQGPRPGDHAVKPDLTAPGIGVVAARAAGTDGDNPVSGHYTALSGTSMATPHVAGAAALLAQAHPDWKGPQLKAALTSSAKPIAGQGAYEQGAGRLDVARATAQSVFATAEDTGVYFADPKATEPVARTVTYHNTGSAEVSLAVASDTTGPDGEPGPKGLFAVSPTVVTVPSGGTAQATVTIDPGAAASGTSFSGRLTATAEGGTVVTGPAFAVTKEAVRRQVTVEAVDRNGAPLGPGSREQGFSSVRLTNLADGRTFGLTFNDGKAAASVPEGRYNLGGTLVTPGTDTTAPTSAMFLQPELDVRQDIGRTVDARQGKPVTVAVPDPGAKPYSLSVGYCYRPDEDEPCTDQSALLGRPGRLYVVPGERASAGALDFYVRSIQNGTQASNGRLPDRYDLLLLTTGSLPDPAFRLAREDLAAVRTHYYAQGPGTAGSTSSWPTESGLGGMSIVEPDFALPAARTEYMTVRGQLRETYFSQHVGAGGEYLPLPVTQTGTVSCTAGGTCVDRWNAAVIGPGLAPVKNDAPSIGRASDGTISAEPQLFSDAAPRHYGGPMPDWLQDTVHLTLAKDGQQLGSSESPRATFAVPQDTATYRLTARATRREPWTPLSTTVEAAWTFRSAAVAPGDDGAVRTDALPLDVVRFFAPVDTTNQTARTEHTLTARVERQAGAEASTTKSLTVQVSFDDGATWQDAPVSSDGTASHRVTITPPPAGSGSFVSLKATALSTDGGTVEQTILHAYHLAP
ncbi:peptidase S8/S53 subtilisin kexin sedolisin [Streptomyces laurentii]|uniref:Peptidase S8/S53 subtilisin kexin sedolisin n=1 Tax=Streptomyces laurentii TaxID=39478 RepID=A0A160P917_STRLU|nr:peptidase S8/S53 subtilisin kexin sedolisin [Streptomyces laurentii]